MRNRDVSLCSGFTLIADSGAYWAKTQGAEVKLPDLCAWANEWRDHFAWVAALDVIGDPAASRRNWEEMRRRGVTAVPTIHFPDPPSAIDTYAREGVTFMGLGGQVGGLRWRMLRWAVSVMRYARDHWPDMQFHGWGTTSRLSLKLPYFSVDSTYWLQGAMWGKTILHDPRNPLCDPQDSLRRARRLPAGGREPAEHVLRHRPSLGGHQQPHELGRHRADGPLRLGLGVPPQGRARRHRLRPRSWRSSPPAPACTSSCRTTWPRRSGWRRC